MGHEPETRGGREMKARHEAREAAAREREAHTVPDPPPPDKARCTYCAPSAGPADRCPERWRLQFTDEIRLCQEHGERFASARAEAPAGAPLVEYHGGGPPTEDAFRSGGQLYSMQDWYGQQATEAYAAAMSGTTAANAAAELRDARRTLAKAEEALSHVEAYFSSKDAMNAAAHLSTRVLPSPLAAEVVSVLEAVRIFRKAYSS